MPLGGDDIQTCPEARTEYAVCQTRWRIGQKYEQTGKSEPEDASWRRGTELVVVLDGTFPRSLNPSKEEPFGPLVQLDSFASPYPPKPYCIRLVRRKWEWLTWSRANAVRTLFRRYGCSPSRKESRGRRSVLQVAWRQRPTREECTDPLGKGQKIILRRKK